MYVYMYAVILIVFVKEAIFVVTKENIHAKANTTHTLKKLFPKVSFLTPFPTVISVVTKVFMIFADGNGQLFSWGFLTLVPFNPNPVNPSWIRVKTRLQT